MVVQRLRLRLSNGGEVKSSSKCEVGTPSSYLSTRRDRCGGRVSVHDQKRGGGQKWGPFDIHLKRVVVVIGAVAVMMIGTGVGGVRVVYLLREERPAVECWTVGHVVGLASWHSWQSTNRFARAK